MTTLEKIEAKKAQIEKLSDEIEKKIQKKKDLEAEIESLKALEIQGMLKEIDVPFDKLRDYLKSLKEVNVT